MPSGPLWVLLGLSTVVSTAPTQIGSESGQPCTIFGKGICYEKKCSFNQAYFDESALACICPDAPGEAVQVRQTYSSILVRTTAHRKLLSGNHGSSLYIYQYERLLQEKMPFSPVIL